jgi:hypothetical protein
VTNSPGCQLLEGDKAPPNNGLVAHTLLERLLRATADATMLVIEAHRNLLEVVSAFDHLAHKVAPGRGWATTDSLWTIAGAERAVVFAPEVARHSTNVACGPSMAAVVGPVPATPARNPLTVGLLPSRLSAGAVATAARLAEQTAAALADADLLRRDPHEARRNANQSRHGLEAARRFASEAGLHPLRPAPTGNGAPCSTGLSQDAVKAGRSGDRLSVVYSPILDVSAYDGRGTSLCSSG